MLGLLIGLSTQIVVFASTVAAYQLNLESYFNHPRALNVESAIPIADALGRRAIGLVAGPVSNGIAAAIGWLLGVLLPARP